MQDDVKHPVEWWIVTNMMSVTDIGVLLLANFILEALGLKLAA